MVLSVPPERTRSAPPTTTAAPEAPAASTRRVTRYKPDAVDLLSIYFALAFLIPGSRVVEPLGGVGRPSIIFGCILFGMWAAAKVIPNRPQPLAPQPLHLFVWLFAVAVLLSTTSAFARQVSGSELNGLYLGLIMMASLLGVMLVAMDGIDDAERLRILIRRIVLFGSFSAVLATIHFFTGNDLSLKLNLPGLTQLTGGSIIGRFGFDRVRGTSLHAIEFGVVMCMLAALALHAALHARNGFDRKLMFGLAFLLAMTSTFSASRSQFVALAVVILPLLFAWRAGWRTRLMGFGVAGILAVNALAPGLLAGVLDLFFNIGEDDSAAAREVDYPVALNAWRHYPIFGRGPGTWGPLDGNADQTGRLLDNEWLGQLVMIGVFGVACLALLYLASLTMARRVYRFGRTDEQRHLAVVLFAILCASAATAFLYDALYYSQWVALTFGAIGLVGAQWRINQAPGPAVDRSVDPDVLRYRRTVRRTPWQPRLGPDVPGFAERSLAIPADRHAEFYERRERGHERYQRFLAREVSALDGDEPAPARPSGNGSHH